MRNLWVITLIFWFGISAARADNVPIEQSIASNAKDLGFSQAGLNRIGRHYKKQVLDQKLPGAVVLIARKGSIVYEGAFGFADIEARSPMRMDTLFRIYSMTKPVITAAALQQIEDGLYSLDTPASVFVPELKSIRVGESKELQDTEITVRHLMTHTAGFSAPWKDDAIARRYRSQFIYESIPSKLRSESRKLPASLDDFMARLSTVELVHQPGKKFTYGLSSDVLGLLVERAGADRLGSILKQRIFSVLSMEDTAFCVDPNNANRLSNLYEYNAKSQLKLDDMAKQSWRLCPVRLESGGSGLISTVKDYWHFAEALRGHLANPDQQILSEQMRLLLRSPQPFVDESETSWWMGGTDWGLGVAQVYDPQKTDYLDVKGNYYWSGGASTYFWIDPQNELVALMFTQVERNGQPNTFKWDFRNLVYEALTSPAEKAQ